MHPMLNMAVRAARKAGDILIKAQDRLPSVKVGEKSRHDYYTEIDHQAEREIIYILQKAYPTHGFIGEEGGTIEGDEHTWIIDPIDGTTNFIHGLPHFCISIALKIKKQIELGVIYDPMRDELFTAVKGSGANFNDRRLRMNQRRPLDGALVSVGMPFHHIIHHPGNVVGLLNQLSGVVGGIRRSGSAALDLAYVAAGRLDGFCEVGLHEWDLAAGALIVREAGGLIADFNGEANYLESGNIIAGAPKVFGGLVKMLQDFPTNIVEAEDEDRD